MTENRGRVPAAKARPAYAITSVDNALRLAAMLQVEGPMTLSQAAERLEVAPSTAHRLLQMLVFRDFAAQAPDRRYLPGPVLRLSNPSPTHNAVLREVALPHMAQLARELGETCNLGILVGSQLHFIASVEGSGTLRVASREGMVFPAHRTSAGLQLLATLSDEEAQARHDTGWYASHPADRPDPSDLRRRLALARSHGSSLNVERSEVGIVALGVPVRDAAGEVVAGLSLAMPAARFDQRQLHHLEGALRASAEAIHRDLAYTSV